jgi:hypothetical protein
MIDAQQSTPEELYGRVISGILHASDKLVADFDQIQSHEVTLPSTPPKNVPNTGDALEEVAIEKSNVETTEDIPLTIEDPEVEE